MRIFFNAHRIRINGDQCVYCGQPATTDEHYPPIAATGATGDGLILPACSECNTLAGANFPYDFDRRVEYVKGKIKNKYRHALRSITWSEEELSELSPKLEKEFRAWSKLSEKTKERLAWNAISYLSLIVPPNAFVALNVKADGSENNEPIWLESLGL